MPCKLYQKRSFLSTNFYILPFRNINSTRLFCNKIDIFSKYRQNHLFRNIFYNYQFLQILGF